MTFAGILILRVAPFKIRLASDRSPGAGNGPFAVAWVDCRAATLDPDRRGYFATWHDSGRRNWVSKAQRCSSIRIEGKLSRGFVEIQLASELKIRESTTGHVAQKSIGVQARVAAVKN